MNTKTNTLRSNMIVGAALTVCLAAVAMSANAAGPGWTANSTVTKLVVTADGGINVQLSPQLSGCISQSGYGGTYASIFPSHPGINRMKADLLAAYLTGGTVALYLADNTCKTTEIILGGL